jgi:diguanylate cyclase (GGDEF)-like protein
MKQALPDRRSQDRAVLALLEALAGALGLRHAVYMARKGDRNRVVAGFGIESMRAAELAELCSVPFEQLRLMHVPDPVRHTALSMTALVQHEKGVRFFCGAPLLSAQDRPVGVLALFDFQNRRLPTAQLALFKEMAAALEELLRLRANSVRDELTGLFNRDHFEEEVIREARRSRRAGEPLGVLVMAVDEFARFNQTHGRTAGTRALRRVGEMLAVRFARAGDVLARYRGAEFVVLLANTDAAQARVAGHRMQQAVRELALPFRGSHAGVVTVSIGLACAGQDALARESNPRVMLSQAYSALRVGQAVGPEQIITHGDAARGDAAPPLSPGSSPPCGNRLSD